MTDKKLATKINKQQQREKFVEKNVKHIIAKRAIKSPITTRDYDYIITDMLTLIGSQETKDFLKEVPLFNSVCKKEDWINGLKYLATQGLFEVYDYKKAVDINDFKAENNKAAPKIYKISKRKYTKYIIYETDMLTIGLDTAKLANYLQIRMKKVKDTFKIHFMVEIAKVITKAAGAELPITYDDTLTGTIDTNANTRKLIRKIREKIVSMKTPSNQHTAFGRRRNNETFKTSYSPSDFTLILDKSFYGARGEMLADVFNRDELYTEITKEYVDFGLIDSAVKSAMVDVYGFLVHKDSLKLGFQVVDLIWTYRIPGAKTIQETHNWYGFGRWDGAPIIKISKA